MGSIQIFFGGKDAKRPKKEKEEQPSLKTC